MNNAIDKTIVSIFIITPSTENQISLLSLVKPVA